MILNMPRVAFDQMRYAFKHKLNINSHYAITRRLAILSGIKPLYFYFIFYFILNPCYTALGVLAGPSLGKGAGVTWRVFEVVRRVSLEFKAFAAG